VRPIGYRGRPSRGNPPAMSSALRSTLLEPGGQPLRGEFPEMDYMGYRATPLGGKITTHGEHPTEIWLVLGEGDCVDEKP